MNKSVPTLLGIAIILLVVVIVVLVYNIKLTQDLVKGGSVVGTVGGRTLTGEQTPTEEISPYEAMGRQASEAKPVATPRQAQREGGRVPAARPEGQGRRGARGAPGTPGAGPGR